VERGVPPSWPPEQEPSPVFVIPSGGPEGRSRGISPGRQAPPFALGDSSTRSLCSLGRNDMEMGVVERRLRERSVGGGCHAANADADAAVCRCTCQLPLTLIPDAVRRCGPGSGSCPRPPAFGAALMSPLFEWLPIAPARSISLKGNRVGIGRALPLREMTSAAYGSCRDSIAGALAEGSPVRHSSQRLRKREGCSVKKA